MAINSVNSSAPSAVNLQTVLTLVSVLSLTNACFLLPRENRPKFTRFRNPNIITAAPPAGGAGVAGRFIPVFDKKLRKHSKYIESPYDAPKMERTAERKDHEKILETLHDSKRFAGQVRRKDHFAKNSETYGLGENPDGTAIVMPIYKDKPKTAPLLDKEGQPMAPWLPSDPAKRVSVYMCAHECVCVSLRILC